MSKSVRAIVGIGLPILAIAVFAVLLAFSLMGLSDVERDMRIEASQNMLWVISRAHVSSLRLGDALTKHSTGEVELSDLELRHNVFLSRVALLNEGPQRRQMTMLGFADVLDSFSDQLPKLAGLIASLPSGDVGSTAHIRALLDPFNAALERAANKAMVTEWDQLGEKLDLSRGQIWRILVSMIAISIAGAFLSIQCLLAMRDARQRARLLEREKAFSELLIGSSGEGILAVDLERRCTVWNEAMERLFDRPATHSTGRLLKEISGLFQIDRIRDAVSNALSGCSTTLLDQPFFPPDRDEPLYIDLHFFSLRDDTRIIGSIIIISDVTARRAAQREIAAHRDHLEMLVRERTRELDAALERERTTADLYRNFGTMVSHQFRTPLAIVDSALQRLMRRSGRLAPGELIARGEKARQAIARLIRLVESTLDAARLDDGQIETQSQPCDLGALAAELCALQSETTPDRKIVLDVQALQPVIARCDPVHVEHILVNLLSNAVKYSSDATPVTVCVSADQRLARCVVSNHGTITSPVDQDRLFERYFRGDNAQGRPGIGMGLYMARMLARMQDGDVCLEDPASGQTMFTLTLPVEPSSALSTDQMRSPLRVDETA